MDNLLLHFATLNDFFDHIYVITLDRARERHKKIQVALAGLDYEFFYGADNKQFSIPDLKAKGIFDEEKAKRIEKYGKPMNPGMLGCSMSHKMVYEQILKAGYKKVLIMEDDVTPNPEGLKVFREIIQELPASWDLLYFDYDKNIHRGLGGWVKQNFNHVKKWLGGLKFSHTTINNTYAKPFSPHLRVAGYHDFTSAYAITAGTAAKLIELQTPIAFWPDHLLAHASSNKLLNAYLTVPKLFIQESQYNKVVVGSYAEE